MPEQQDTNEPENSISVGAMLVMGLIPAAVIGVGLAVLTVYLCCPDQLPAWLR